ncbi:hypothetical protein BH11BAC7_BH11BAC7_31590 [soil metagenome]
MKKHLLTIASVAMIAGVVSFSSCKKDDATAPTITVTGGNAQTISLNSTWSAPSATAADDVDGDISSSITVGGDVVNPNLAGVYNVTYTVSDAAGNTSTETVAVTVQNDAAYLAGNYDVRDSVDIGLVFLYTMNINASTTVNNRIEFNTGVDAVTSSTVGYADYQNNTNIYATVTGTNVTLPSQTATGIGSAANESHTFNGNGSVWAPSVPSFIIVYNDMNNTNSTTANNCKQYYVVHQ